MLSGCGDFFFCGIAGATAAGLVGFPTGLAARGCLSFHLNNSVLTGCGEFYHSIKATQLTILVCFPTNFTTGGCFFCNLNNRMDTSCRNGNLGRVGTVDTVLVCIPALFHTGSFFCLRLHKLVLSRSGVNHFSAAGAKTRLSTVRGNMLMNNLKLVNSVTCCHFITGHQTKGAGIGAVQRCLTSNLGAIRTDDFRSIGKYRSIICGAFN